MIWKKHIKAKRDAANLRFKSLYWLLGRKSKLSLSNKLLVYKAVIKPIWTYGIQLWGSASDSNINIIQRMQNAVLKSISTAPWYIRNTELHQTLRINTVKEEIVALEQSYTKRLAKHPNILAAKLTEPRPKKRLKRHNILELHKRV